MCHTCCHTHGSDTTGLSDANLQHTSIKTAHILQNSIMLMDMMMLSGNRQVQLGAGEAHQHG
jgi:hypothetical protein